ncbi:MULTISPECIES: F0F1 ATP synthase subunit epsilon [Apibacter]|uniref:FoF1 ATP synthase subunit delta/epsilon n=1 Tax=Apibacter TaxID=1778601 RepID=UPI001C6A5DC0|nr:MULTISPECIES: F0F1 ATP synthase subunit epsilon [Apibacter]QYN50557.1 F0F1 ATP synthase subunit epsilon [Apibacter sp. ESL0404]
MKIQILTPEEVIFDGEVSSITVPGSLGEFQMLENHASIVSTLEPGIIKLENVSSSSNVTKLKNEGKYQTFTIKSGLLEFNNNKGIILCD